MDFYSFFSFSAKKAVYRASEVCSQFNNQFLEPEHVFHSVLNQRSCSAVQVLHTLDVNLPKLAYSLEAYLYEHSGDFKGSAVFSQRTIAMLELAYKEVKRLHHREIGTTHLLLALAQDHSPFLRQLAEEHQLDARRIREALLAHLKGYDQGRQPAAGLSQRPPQATAEAAQFSFGSLLDSESLSLLRYARQAAQQYRHRELLPLHAAFAMVLTARTDSSGFFRRAGVHQGRLMTDLAVLLSRLDCMSEPMPEALLESSALLDLVTRAMRSALERARPLGQRQSQGGAVRISPRDLLYATLQDPDEQLQQILQQHGLSPATLKPLELDVEVYETDPEGSSGPLSGEEGALAGLDDELGQRAQDLRRKALERAAEEDLDPDSQPASEEPS
ncbi:hypothetical protein IT575_01255 [bacterium]|nr:hypothetical protein [bacterium]